MHCEIHLNICGIRIIKRIYITQMLKDDVKYNAICNQIIYSFSKIMNKKIKTKEIEDYFTN
eukprot:GAHX01001954.1.p2 GENE.GAHX01001954.1~~GAHX01001954.1.p2  ORF type:complete len:61 (+),score=4.94 GAHX01001954.1:653-835(+)